MILERLNQVHITLSHETKRNILNDFGEYSTEKIIQGIAQGKDGKLNGDNLDLYVTTNDVRMDNKSKDYHFFATDLTFDRVDCKNLDDSKPVGDTKNITYKNFVPSPNEISRYKESLKVLLDVGYGIGRGLPNGSVQHLKMAAGKAEDVIRQASRLLGQAAELLTSVPNEHPAMPLQQQLGRIEVPTPSVNIGGYLLQQDTCILTTGGVML